MAEDVGRALTGQALVSDEARLRGLHPSGFDPSRRADLELALDYALRILIHLEPGDSRAMSNEFVAMASIQADLTNEECREILRAAIDADEVELAAKYDEPAIATEARRAKTTQIGLVEDDGAGLKGIAKTSEPSQ